MRATIPIVFLALSVGCVRHYNAGSQTKGHYEDYSKERLERYAGRLSFVPEYTPGQSVIISEQLFESVQLDMLESILNAGAPRLYVVMESKLEGESRSASMKDILRTRVDAMFAKVDEKMAVDLKRILDKMFVFIIPIVQESPLYVHEKEEGLTVWARDWSPLAARLDTGGTVLMDLNYYAERQLDDGTSRSFLKYFSRLTPRIPNPFIPSERVNLPIYNEGGNFMNTPEWCLMTERVVDANRWNGRRGLYFKKVHVEKSGGKISEDQPFTREELIAMYNRFGCKRTEIFPKLPHEGTGHIDMWSKLISDKKVLVGDLRDEAIEAARTPAAEVLRGGKRSAELDIAEMKEMQIFLRERQTWFRDHGFEVLTLPMPANIYYYSQRAYDEIYADAIKRGATPERASEMASEWAQTVETRSYTNSLMLNGTLITPRYSQFSGYHGKLDYPDAALLAKYEDEVRTTIEKAGFKVSFVETDDLISWGGSVHCTTMQVPW